MKVCSGCLIAKSETDFFVRDRNTGRLHAACKTCHARKRKAYYTQHYATYGNLYRARAKARNEQKRQQYRDFMTAFLQSRTCIDCGESDPVVLELDHRDPSRKSFTVSQAVKLSRTEADVIAEVSKCDVVCANCHKRRTARDFNWYKYKE